MKHTFRKTLLASLVVPFALGASSVSAATLINNWGYQVDNTFVDATETTGTPSLSGNNTNTLTWGIGTGPKSSLSITDVNDTSGLFTNLGPVDGGVLTHTNNVLPAAGAALKSFKLNSTLTLNPFDPDLEPALAPQTTSFSSFFNETGNTASANCGFTSTSGCDDIFTVGNPIAAGGAETADGYEFARSFDYIGYTYTVFLELLGLTVLEDEACLAAEAALGCVGLLTLENQATTFDTRFRITGTEIPVPEPGTLALLGMGLAGLGMSRRKKAAKA